MKNTIKVLDYFSTADYFVFALVLFLTIAFVVYGYLKRKNSDNKFVSKQINVFDIPSLINLIKELKISIVINVASAFCNMSIFTGSNAIYRISRQ